MCFVLLLLASGCSKTVSKEAGVFRQLEPDPTPTSTSTPSPVPTATPTPEPTDPVGCDLSLLGDLPKYSIYTIEDLKLTEVTVGKRVAAADAIIHKAVLGYRLKKDKTRTDLATVYDLELSKTRVLKGNATYGKNFNAKKTKIRGGVKQAEFSMVNGIWGMKQFSTDCANAEPNTKLVRKCVKKICTLRIQGTNPNLNIAEVTEEDLKGVHILSLEVPSTSTVVANIPDVRIGAFKKVAVIHKGKKWPTAYWNFPEAEKLSFKGTFFYGTVIAPDAEVAVCAQAGKAGFWSRTLSGSGAAWW